MKHHSLTFFAASLFGSGGNVIVVMGQGGSSCSSFQDDLPINEEDYGQPDWAAIVEQAFPSWTVPSNFSCPRLDQIGGVLEEGYTAYPTPEAGKFNPCYYTKAFAGLDPMLGGYPTPVDTKYYYEFAAPFFKQPGDGSTHHCALDAAPTTPVQSCPHVGTGGCGDGVKDCNKLTEEFGIGFVPPFVALAAVKNAFLDCEEDVCAWFDDASLLTVDSCSIPKSVMDRLVLATFGNPDDGTVRFTPPLILDDVPASDPKSTYYKLEFVNDPIACADDNCRGPHYCSKAAAEEDVWGDFCPYIHTGDNAGLYRHPHLALAAMELWLAHKCQPERCPMTWLDSPNGQGYGEDKMTSTSITWSEMDDNTDPMAQPAVPYSWPNTGDGIFPGHELYGDMLIKPASGSYVNRYVVGSSMPSSSSSEASSSSAPAPALGGNNKNGFVVMVTATIILAASIIVA